MAYSQISESRLQRIYEGAHCSTLETRFLIERLRISERALGMLAEGPEIHSAEQFATHLLRGQGLVRLDNFVADQASSPWIRLQTGLREFISTARTCVRAVKLRSAA